MTDAALLRHLGPRVVHVTARANVAAIEAYGMYPPAELAALAGQDPQALALRKTRQEVTTPFGTAVLNHQNPINHGFNAANSIVDGYTAAQWAAQLDRRVYFSRQGGKTAFRKSVANDVPIAVLSFDTDAMLTLLGDRLFLCPINSGNFTQGGAHARRGDWIYVPATAGLQAFRHNRTARGLVATIDTVTELSVLGSIPPQTLRALDMRIAA